MPGIRLSLLCASLLLWSTYGLASDARLFYGAWQVDVSRLPVPDPPASVTITWSDATGGKTRMTVEIVDRQGVKSRAEGVFTLDGTPARAKGSLDVDIASFTMPSRHVLVMGAGMAGNPSNTRVFVVSEDGKSMSETIVSHGPGNIPAIRVNAWTRK